jgi:diguanylate cyclase (GGDEF)-like protein
MRPEEYYGEVWESLERDGSWEGELQHSKSSGECYWADTVVLPKTDEEGVLVGYSVIHQDITDKKRIEELSITDEMTGLHNRRYFNVIIKKELGRARRERHNLIFAMLDIDFFKQYNDNYGHQKGDEVLKEVSSIMKDKLSRASDYCFRLGGEEFGILFSNKQSGNSYEFVDLIRKAIEERAIEHKWSAVADVVTVSIGMQTIAPDDPVSVDLLYKIADKALYTAKNEGRNRLVARTFDITDEVG